MKVRWLFLQKNSYYDHYAISKSLPMNERFIQHIIFMVKIIVFCLLLSGIKAFAENRTVGFETPIYCKDCTTLDIDNDGDLDIVTGHSDGSGAQLDTLMVLVNNGYMHYTREYYITSNFNDALCTGDFNGDGFDDIAVASWNNRTRIFYNDGYGHFDNCVTISTTRGGCRLECADVDNDGDLDLFYLSDNINFGYYFGFLKNNNGTFYNNQHVESYVGYKFTNIGDMNGDGLIDVVCGNTIYLNALNHFDTSTISPGVTYTISTIADFDNDGDLDIIIAIESTPIYLYVAENQGNMVFVTHPDYYIVSALGYAISRFFADDLNNDGYTDIMFMTKASAPIQTDMYLYILINDNGNGFENQSIYFNRLGVVHWINLIETADLNGDDYKDILISSVWPNDEYLDYYFYLLTIMNDGNGIFSQYVENEDDVTTDSFNRISLSVYPNPVLYKDNTEITILINGITNISESLDDMIKIYNIKGQLIDRLLLKDNKLTWRCEGLDHNKLPPGLYIIEYLHKNIVYSSSKITIL
jgi:hypothetical protein